MRTSLAKRAPRASVKSSSATPYTTSSPSTQNEARRISLQPLKAIGFISRMASTLVQKVLHTRRSPLKYGGIIRDVPYHIQKNTVGFFSTHSSLCDEVFAVSHGESIRFTSGPWTNETAVVLGVRGGVLWVVSRDGPPVARPLINGEQCHRWEKTNSDPTLMRRFNDGLEEARRDAAVGYSEKQREFLQKAPDMYVEVVDDEGDAFEEDSPFFDNYNGHNEEEKEDVTGRRISGRVTEVAYTSSSDAANDNDNNNDRSRGRSGSGNSSTSNDSGGARKRVILVPQLLHMTDDLGWAGEGAVVVDGGGVKSFAASLSAAVLL